MNLSIVQSTRLFQNLPDAFVLQRLLYDDLGHPEDFVILDTNKAFSSLFNTSKTDICQRYHGVCE